MKSKIAAASPILIFGVIAILIYLVYQGLASPATLGISNSKYGTATYYCDYDSNSCTFSVNFNRHGTFMDSDVRIYYSNSDDKAEPDSNLHVYTSKENCAKIGGTSSSDGTKCYIVNLLNQQIQKINYGSTTWKVLKFEDPSMAYTDIYINAASFAASGDFIIPIYNVTPVTIQASEIPEATQETIIVPVISSDNTINGCTANIDCITACGDKTPTCSNYKCLCDSVVSSVQPVKKLNFFNKFKIWVDEMLNKIFGVFG